MSIRVHLWLKKNFFAFWRPGGKKSGVDFEPTDSDLEQVVDAARKDLGLGPARRDAAQGIADMDARINELRALKGRLLDNEAADAEISSVNQQLAEAHQRRGEYETLLISQN